MTSIGRPVIEWTSNGVVQRVVTQRLSHRRIELDDGYACRCPVYWTDLIGNHVRIQHGENAEAIRVFPAKPYKGSDYGGKISGKLLRAWLAAIHAYEVGR